MCPTHNLILVLKYKNTCNTNLPFYLNRLVLGGNFYDYKKQPVLKVLKETRQMALVKNQFFFRDNWSVKMAKLVIQKRKLEQLGEFRKSKRSEFRVLT